MFSTPIPRSSFLDSPLRVSSLLNRRLAHAQPVGESHLGRSSRLAPTRPALSGDRHDDATGRGLTRRA